MRKINLLATNDIIKYYLEGQSENSLAKQHNVSRAVVTRILKESNIKRRGRSEAELLKWSQMTPEKRKHQVEAAHITNKGSKHPRDKLWNIPITESETYFINLVNKYNWPLIYCGQGGIIINGCNPDFIHKTDKKVIEVYTGVKHEEKEKQYSKADFLCLFLGLKNSSEQFIKEKVESFLSLT